jgi:gas vesicle protein
MKTSERIMWLMIGAGVGAGIALLYAPKTGRDTRRLIRRKADDAREALSETGETLYRKASTAASAAADYVR